LIFALLLSVPCHAVAYEGTTEDVISIDTHIHTEMCVHSTETTIEENIGNNITEGTTELSEASNIMTEAEREAYVAKLIADAEAKAAEELENARLAEYMTLLRKIGYTNVYITEYNGKKVVGAEVTLDKVHLISNVEARATITQALNNASLNSTSSCSHEWMDIVIGDEHPHETPQMCMLCGASQTIYLFDLWHQDSTPSATHTSQGHAYTRECTFGTCTYSETLYKRIVNGDCQECCYIEYGHTFIGETGYLSEHPHYYYDTCSICDYRDVSTMTYSGVYPGCATCNAPCSHSYSDTGSPSSTHSTANGGHAQTQTCSLCGDTRTVYVEGNNCCDCGNHSPLGIFYNEAAHPHAEFEECGICWAVLYTGDYGTSSDCEICYPPTCTEHNYLDSGSPSNTHDTTNGGHAQLQICFNCAAERTVYVEKDYCCDCGNHSSIGIPYFEPNHPHAEYTECASCWASIYTGNYGTIEGCEICYPPTCDHIFGSWTEPSATHSSLGHSRTRSCTQCGEIDIVYNSHYDDCTLCEHNYSINTYCDTSHSIEGHIEYGTCSLGNCNLIGTTGGYHQRADCASCHSIHTYGSFVHTSHKLSENHYTYYKCTFVGCVCSDGCDEESVISTSSSESCFRCVFGDGGDYYIINIEHQKYIHKNSSVFDAVSLTNLPDSSHQFTIIPNSVGEFEIKSKLGSYYIGCNGSTVIINNSASISTSKWILEKSGLGYYRFISSVYPAYVLDVTGNSLSIDLKELQQDAKYLDDEWMINSINNGLSSITLEPQQKDQWCWVASARMASKALMESQITQGPAAANILLDEGTYTIDVTENNVTREVTVNIEDKRTLYFTEDELAAANHGATISQVGMALDRLTGGNMSYSLFKNIYEEDVFRQLIALGNPIILGRSFFYNIDLDATKEWMLGHAVVVIGYEEGEEIAGEMVYKYLVYDPWSVNVGNTYWASYDFLRYGNKLLSSDPESDMFRWDNTATFKTLNGLHEDYIPVTNSY